MPAETIDYHIRSKLWIEDAEGNVVFGLGRYHILDAIDRLGSLQAAAKDLRMSYRAVWCRIKASEERLGQSLVAREGRGSCLTPLAKKLMKQYRRIQTVVENESDEIYDDLMSDHLTCGAEQEIPQTEIPPGK
jgi:molybdate transport system regulatory protein